MGFRIVRAFAQRHGIESWRSKFAAQVAQLRDLDAVLALPQTFMNDSGDSVARLVTSLKADVRNLLVVCDDINLEFGQLRFRRRGSDGGHNGLRSIIAALGTQDFPRLRAGVGRSIPDAIGVVLGPFTAKEEEALPEIIDRAVAGIEIYLREGVEAAIAAVNAAGGRGTDAEE